MKRIATMGALATVALALGVQQFTSSSARVLNNGNLAVRFAQTGLDGVQSYRISANVNAVYGCLNKGGQVQRGKTATVNEMVALVQNISSQGGNLSRDVQLKVPNAQLECPKGQSKVLTSVSWTNVSVVNNTTNTTQNIQGTFSKTFHNVK
jgi:hypothetical protein